MIILLEDFSKSIEALELLKSSLQYEKKLANRKNALVSLIPAFNFYFRLDIYNR